MKQAEKKKVIAKHFTDIQQLAVQLRDKHDQVSNLDFSTPTGLAELGKLNEEIKSLTKKYAKYGKYAKNPPTPKKPKETK